MATRWEDPQGWSYADWSNTNQNVLLNHLWDSLKGAADERCSFMFAEHSDDYDPSYTFPDFNQTRSVFANASSPDNNSIKIENSIFPIDEAKVIENGTIKESGFYTGTADKPQDLTLAELLTGPLAYPSGNLLHMIDTSDGNNTAIPKMNWVKQWFQVMDYPKDYSTRINALNPFIDNIEGNTWELDFLYRYNIVTQTFISCVCDVGAPPTNDIYSPGDLNETFPFSTAQECYDYAIDKILSTFTYVNKSVITHANLRNDSAVKWFAATGGSQIEAVSIRMKLSKYRFTLNDSFRPISPNKFTPQIWSNSYYTVLDDSLGTGRANNEIEFVQLSPVSGNTYDFVIPNTDFSSMPAPANPGDPDETGTVFRNSLESRVGIVQGLIFRPNQTDGSGYEFYTP